jgi:carotenoid cleavage dioxygenase
MTPPYLSYYRIDAAGRLLQIEPIEIPRPVMMHDWNVTRNHVIFMDLPLVFDLANPKGPGFGFRRDLPARLGVMPRNGGNKDVRWYEVNPCYVFHPLNAHEEGDRIVVHVCRLREAMVGGMDEIGDDDDKDARLWRWTIDPSSGAVREEQLDDLGADFPRVDDRRVGLAARYGYVMGLMPGTSSLTYDRYLYRYDLENGTRQRHDLGEGWHAGEPVFAPRSPDAAEDDGFILAIAHDQSAGESWFVVLDARDFAGPPLAKVKLPRRVPYGAHGAWLPDPR